jgi:hypothetical protein
LTAKAQYSIEANRKINQKFCFEIILAMSVSTYETVKAALEKDDRQYLKDIEADLKKRIDGVPKRSIKDLLSALY